MKVVEPLPISAPPPCNGHGSGSLAQNGPERWRPPDVHLNKGVLRQRMAISVLFPGLSAPLPVCHVYSDQFRLTLLSRHRDRDMEGGAPEDLLECLSCSCGQEEGLCHCVWSGGSVDGYNFCRAGCRGTDRDEAVTKLVRRLGRNRELNVLRRVGARRVETCGARCAVLTASCRAPEDESRAARGMLLRPYGGQRQRTVIGALKAATHCLARPLPATPGSDRSAPRTSGGSRSGCVQPWEPDPCR